MADQILQPGAEMMRAPVLPNPLADSLTERVAGLRGMALNAAATLAVAVDLPGVNEAVRGTILTATELTTHNSYIAAAATTAATLGIEAAGAVGVSRLLDTERGHRVMGVVRKALGALGIKGTCETSPVTDSAIAFTTGVAAMTTVKQEADHGRTSAQNRHYGLRMAVGVSIASAPVSYLVAEGVGDLVSPEKVGLAALGIAAMVATARKARQFIQARTVEQTKEARVGAEMASVEARYDLAEQELKAIELNLVDKARQQHGRTISAVWLRGNSNEANFIRTHEARVFHDINIPGLFEPYDDTSIFLAVVDTRRGAGRVIRGTRIMGRQFATNDPDAVEGNSGMAMIQDLVEDGQITQSELTDYYGAHGIDLDKCISVETNFRIGERAPRKLGFIPIAQLAYLAMYQYVLRHDSTKADACVFAHVNKASENSLTRLGMSFDRVAGRDDLRTPAGPGSDDRYDDKFTPVALINSPQTAHAMRRLLRFAPPETYM